MDPIVTAIIGAVAGILVGFLVGFIIRKKIGEAKIGSAEAEAKKILEEAKKNAESAKKEALIEVKEKNMAQRNELEREIRERRSEISRLENRIAKKEETLDKKTEALEHKNEILDKKIKENEELREVHNEILKQQLKKLEEISGISIEQAKQELFERVESEVKHELAQRLDELETQFKEEADDKAKNILSLAIQRYASDHVSEATVSSVALPSDEMKGRIIGREGRNIQKIETLTGVELVIDDTPETITLSGFDPVRREVARIALERLISDGRIHPARIEEMVEKAQKEVEASVKQAGERATFEVGIHGIHPELVKLLGRLKYRTSYGQNVLKHSIEVAFLAGIMADELGVDSNIAKRAGLLHDIGKAFPHDVEGSHVEIGVNAAKKRTYDAEKVKAGIEATLKERNLSNCLVYIHNGLVAEYTKQKNIKYMIRGLRNNMDYNYEENIAEINKLINPNLEYVYFRAENVAVSSSMVKELKSFGSDVSKFVPEAILKVMNE